VQSALFYRFDTMEHVLDSPAWHALNMHNRELSFGNDKARCFNREVSPFAAISEINESNFRLLCDAIDHNGTTLFMTPVEIEIPSFWKQLALIRGIQMVWHSSVMPGKMTMELKPLTYTHVPQMLELTKLTNPGPFDSRTIDFGHYFGIFEGDSLAAMAGQRLHVPGYAEISAVCTHPDHTGKGYARQLLLHQVHRIIAAGETPYLHVRADNERAIKVYESLGFLKRTDMYFYVLRKEK
jgi:ribosomal protein S18 acetylase RimI-like enzyme